MEIAADTAVTIIEARISGKIPKSGGLDVGYQYFPKTNFKTDICLKIGSPSMNKKAIIINRMAIETVATLKNMIRTDFSVL